ncbi:MAG: YggS family pyridoxal phosphate-dependent enzyme [Clostridiales bacterium]|jgi:pyridoxal phosphate enzyme (YggS family)|nr:YggS family pyridoxal phosphate-dependent enzyme [Clostridiales bacterium]
MSTIEDNVRNVLGRAEAAAKRAGRDFKDITVVGVTKTQDAEAVIAMARAGINNAGENRVQEFLPKREAVAAADAGFDIRWHMIGHLQTNKVKQVLGKAALIHSVDSFRLAEEINRLGGADVLIEVNIAEEAGKFGIKPDDALYFVEKLVDLPKLNLRGLMCVAPYVENPEENRIYFRKMKNILLDINKKRLHNVAMEILSMGMTADYEVAIEEGATVVRVGTGIFGERQQALISRR